MAGNFHQHLTSIEDERAKQGKSTDIAVVLRRYNKTADEWIAVAEIWITDHGITIMNPGGTTEADILAKVKV